jgi:carbon-monoxide dehydrogenase medium subunit
MIPAAFDYHRPGTLDEAIELLSRYGSEAKLLSGGMSLLPAMKLRLGSFAHLVDIGRIPGLEYITEGDGVLRIGAGTRQCVLERSELINSKYGILADARARAPRGDARRHPDHARESVLKNKGWAE